MLEVEINGQPLTVEDGSTVLDAATQAGVYVPHFCYHKKLSIAANCRMCLVEVEKASKPLPACATPVTDGMKVHTHSALAIDAQQGVMEFLLINHPLDCPVCDQGGECQLQDLAVGYGASNSRFTEFKRAVTEKYLGPLIATEMTRCIHCTRCVRFGQEVAGKMELGMAYRTEHAEILPFVAHTVDSEVSGNMIDLCPVGALTSKPFRFTARPWELSRRKSISPHDGLGSNLIMQVRQNRVMRVLPFENESVNECWLSDRDRFSYEALNSEHRLLRPQIKQGGVWNETDWSQAFLYLKEGLHKIRQTQGANAVAGLISPHSTLEELYLFQRLLRDFGSPHIDHRLRQSDFSDDATLEGAPWLGQPIANLNRADAVLLIGSHLRKEQPLLASRLRSAAQRGARLSSISPLDSELLLTLAAKAIVPPQQMVLALAAVVQSLVHQTGSEVQDNALSEAIASVERTDASDQLAEQLCAGETRIVLLGELAQYHPQAAQLRRLALEIARLANATLGTPAAAANSVGAYWVGAVPMHGVNRSAVTQRGDHARELLTQSKAAYILFNTEPERDSYDSARALKALNGAEMVVHCAPFVSDAALEYADILLPITPFSETPGCFVNMEGRLQAFHAVAKPLGEARPGWKVLRVLANQLDLPGYAYASAEEIRTEIQQQLDTPSLLSNVNHVTVFPDALERKGLRRVAEVPLYQSDLLVRRAPSLQMTADAAPPIVQARAEVLAALGIQDGDWVQVQQGEATLSVIARASARVAPDCVSLPAAHLLTVGLGGMFDEIQLRRA